MFAPSSHITTPNGSLTRLHSSHKNGTQPGETTQSLLARSVREQCTNKKYYHSYDLYDLYRWPDMVACWCLFSNAQVMHKMQIDANGMAHYV